ncbi:MAG: SDR family NAD(P)-dependent oxidoreductase [Spirochaetales bacterium]|nr:SDR family NAD(P)-dependent oxidoreductase [Spirochaetales bacterium]
MALIRYLTQYRFRDMGELIRNDKKEPLDCSNSLEGKTVVLSGATSGIGLEAAHLFAEKGASLICLNRDTGKSARLEKELRDRFNCKIQNMIVDFRSFEQLKRCADDLLKIEKPIDILIHNAGVYNTKKQFSQDNIEMVFHVNHLGSFLLNYLLKEKLKTENRARIIYVNSEGHRFALAGVHLKDLDWRRHFYTGLKSYGAAKTAQLLTMLKYNEYFSDCRVTINAMHPGNVKSKMGDNNGKLYRMMKKKLVLSSAKDPSISARALYYLAASDEVEAVSGKFFNLTTEENPAPHARDISAVDPLWNKSRQLCGLS